MRFKPWSLPVLAALALPCGSALADDDAYDGRYYFAPMYSHIFEDSNRPTQSGMGGTLALGKRLGSHLELELLGSYIAYKEDDYTRRNLLCNLLGNCRTFEGGTYESKTVGLGLNIPFQKGGTGPYLRGDVLAGNGSRFLYDGGLGYRWMLNDNVGVRAEALYHSDDGDYTETQINLGLHILLGKKPLPPAPAPEPVAVVPVEPVAAPCAMPEAGQPVNFDNCKTGDVMVLRGVHFATADSTLTTDAEAILDGVATALTAKTDLRVEVQGHTDSVGEDDYNMALSQRRAKSVKTYLSEHGVDTARMHSLGFGETQPVDSNDTDEGRELNRRVELKLVAADAPAFGADEEPAPVKRKKRAAPVEAESTDATAVEATDATSAETAPAEGDASSGSPDAAMTTEEEQALVNDANGTSAEPAADASSTDATTSTDATGTEAAPADAGTSAEPAPADATTTSP